MNNIIKTLKGLYATDKAECLNMLPELFKQYDEGLIKVLPCAIGDTVLLNTEIMGCEIGKMPYKITGVWLSASGNFGAATQSRFISMTEAEKALKSAVIGSDHDNPKLLGGAT